MSAEISRSNGYVSIMPALHAVLTWLRRFQRSRLIALDNRLEQEGLTAHMARDVGLSHTSLIYDGRRADREA